MRARSLAEASLKACRCVHHPDGGVVTNVREIADGLDADDLSCDGSSHNSKAGVDRPNGDGHAPELSSGNLVSTL